MRKLFFWFHTHVRDTFSILQKLCGRFFRVDIICDIDWRRLYVSMYRFFILYFLSLYSSLLIFYIFWIELEYKIYWTWFCKKKKFFILIWIHKLRNRVGLTIASFFYRCNHAFWKWLHTFNSKNNKSPWLNGRINLAQKMRFFTRVPTHFRDVIWKVKAAISRMIYADILMA